MGGTRRGGRQMKCSATALPLSPARLAGRSSRARPAVGRARCAGACARTYRICQREGTSLMLSRGSRRVASAVVWVAVTVGALALAGMKGGPGPMPEGDRGAPMAATGAPGARAEIPAAPLAGQNPDNGVGTPGGLVTDAPPPTAVAGSSGLRSRAPRGRTAAATSPAKVRGRDDPPSRGTSRVACARPLERWSEPRGAARPLRACETIPYPQGDG